MPLSYRRPPRPASPDPSITDADDSIFLSDLVRTGEASRLRRRGAIRDGPSASTHRAPPNNSISPFPGPPQLQVPNVPPSMYHPPEPAAVPSPIWDNDPREADPDAYLETYGYDDDDDAGGEWEWGRREGVGSAVLMEREGRREALEAEVRLEEAEQAAGSYMLFCGGDLPDDKHNDHAHTSSHLDAYPRRRATAFCPVLPRPASKPRRTNGCGALVHVSALPTRRHGVWIARGVAGEAVVPLDSSYFDCKAVAKMMKSACGCIREGVGCRACGNTLGTIYTPCQTAAEGLFLPPTSLAPSAHSHPYNSGPFSLRGPSGPAYWLPPAQHPRLPSASSTSPSSSTASSSASSSPSTARNPHFAIYTFFSGNVRSSPGFSFPAPIPAPAPVPSTTAENYGYSSSASYGNGNSPAAGNGGISSRRSDALVPVFSPTSGTAPSSRRWTSYNSSSSTWQGRSLLQEEWGTWGGTGAAVTGVSAQDGRDAVRVVEGTGGGNDNPDGMEESEGEMGEKPGEGTSGAGVAGMVWPDR
ncbi:hypothetical protein EW146_g2423 [Bondarzewia mesenterica]|uniref:Uncharacterized protein n=1 Tax=Bondarzewia mesenterica TaxID=1095465 RepID=A0A4S4M0T9_9AGAM|nr:hypothetical protein EW146_g2423 [Bondarzewia mesenterica]